MGNTDDLPRERVQLRKYRNRRYYDAAHSRHVTLEEIYGMIREGAEVHVTDSESGEDITAKVLAQIILEHDPPKLGIFPVELLHQLIRANQPLVRDFVEKYFNQAFSMFLASQRQFERYLRDSLGLQVPLWTGDDWTRLMTNPLAAMFGAPQANGNPGGEETLPEEVALPESKSAPAGPEVWLLLSELRDQVKALRQELDRRSPRGKTKSNS
jgi:polyhydroxyalkanoate synthesis repressor PhaR